jgi:hypothetical protein
VNELEDQRSASHDTLPSRKEVASNDAKEGLWTR